MRATQAHRLLRITAFVWLMAGLPPEQARAANVVSRGVRSGPAASVPGGLAPLRDRALPTRLSFTNGSMGLRAGPAAPTPVALLVDGAFDTVGLPPSLVDNSAPAPIPISAAYDVPAARRPALPLNGSAGALALVPSAGPREAPAPLTRRTAELAGPSRAEKDWSLRRETVLRDATELRRRLEAWAARREAEVGPEAFREEINQDRTHIEDPLLGRAELNTIDGVRVVRVAHAPTELAVIFAESGPVSPASRHFKQVVARHHIDGGRRRRDGQTGRDLIVVWERGGNGVGEDIRPRPSPWSPAWYTDYWRATWKRPGQGDVILGLLSGAAQGLLALTLSGLKIWAGTSTSIIWFPIIFTMAFGSVIGVFASTYINWTIRGTQRSQWVKSGVVSVLFAYPVALATFGLAALLPWTLGGLLLQGHIAMNVALNNLGKVAWQQYSKMGRDNRRFNKTLPLGINHASAVHQSLYLINWTFRLGDLMGVPLGKAAFILSIPLARTIVLRYAERQGFPEAAEIRAHWERDKRRAGWIWRKLLPSWGGVTSQHLTKSRSLLDVRM